MGSQPGTNIEQQDAELVNDAQQAIFDGNLNRAELILCDVVSRTPQRYALQFESDGKLHIRFWDTDCFLHYVTWNQQERDLRQGIVWVASAYPRAYYYLGFISVKRGDFKQAIEYLDLGSWS